MVSMLATPIGPPPVKGLGPASQRRFARLPRPDHVPSLRRMALRPPGPLRAPMAQRLSSASRSGPQDAPTSRPAQIRTRAHCTSSRHGLGNHGVVGGLARPAGPIGLARQPPTSRWAGAMGGVTSERPRGCRRDQGAVTKGP